MATISFGTSDGVTGSPTIDGFIDHDFLNIGEPGEPGYTNGFRRTFDGGTLSPVILQGVRVATGDRLVIGVLARFDNSWDNADQVIIALKPLPTSGQGEARMLLIKPVFNGTGATDSGAGSGANQIKTNVLLPITRWDLYKGNATGTPWTEVGAPAIEIRVRSWVPMRPAGSSGEKAWSLEISVPRLAGGNPNWLDLADGFGAYINIIRANPGVGAIQNAFPVPLSGSPVIGPNLVIPAASYGTALIPDLQTPPGINPGLGIFFPNGSFSIGVRPTPSNDPAGSAIRGQNSADTRDNELIANVLNTGPDVAGIQATFAFANWGLGTQWTMPTTLPINPTTPSGTIAEDSNRALTTVWTRAEVSASQFQPPPGKTINHQCMTATLSASSAVNFVQVATRRNMDFISLSDYEREAEINTEGLPDPAGGVAEHDILLRTFAREIRLGDIVLAKSDGLSSDLVAVVSGALATGAAKILEEYDVSTEALFQGDISAEVRRALAQSLKDHVAIVWFTEGLRRTGSTLTIDGTAYEDLATELGSFGYVAHHVGIADSFSWSITGDGITRIAPGLLRIRIKPGETARLNVRVAMSPEERPGDISKVPRDPDWKPGKEPPEPDRPPFDLISFIRRRFRSLFSFLTRERQ